MNSREQAAVQAVVKAFEEAALSFAREGQRLADSLNTLRLNKADSERLNAILSKFRR